ncbi:MAG TPA: DoxX-like family protein [Bryobacteraceae bacterium]|nr:DoxX-like family protein [Bryobacteraceae bacterium]
MFSLFLPRIAIAFVWIHQGLWCKLLGHAPQHRRVVETIPIFNTCRARQTVVALGLTECFLAVWVFSGIGAREAAFVETLLLVLMNTGGMLWARRLISDPVNMLLQNFVFLLLAWVAAGAFGTYASGR